MGRVCTVEGALDGAEMTTHRTSRSPEDLEVNLREIHLAFMQDCKRAGLDIVTICTYRSDEDQAKALACGASNCKPGQSKHNHKDAMGRPASLAFDVDVIRNGKYIGNGKDPHYLEAGKIGEAHGLKWAGRWTGKLKETGHFEL